MSTINEKNIVDIVDGKIWAGTPIVQVSMADKTLTIPITPSSAFEVVGESGNIIDIAESSVKPDTPVIIVDGMAYPCYSPHRVVEPLGELYAWGDNAYGQLGLGDTVNRDTPTLIPSNTKWKSVINGYGCFYAIDIDNNLYGWGRNNVRQLGLGDTENRLTPTFIKSNVEFVAVWLGNVFCVDTDGNVWEIGGYNGITQLTNQGGWRKIAIAEDQLLGLSLDYKVYVINPDTFEYKEATWKPTSSSDDKEAVLFGTVSDIASGVPASARFDGCILKNGIMYNRQTLPAQPDIESPYYPVENQPFTVDAIFNDGLVLKDGYLYSLLHIIPGLDIQPTYPVALKVAHSTPAVIDTLDRLWIKKEGKVIVNSTEGCLKIDLPYKWSDACGLSYSESSDSTESGLIQHASYLAIRKA